MSSTSIIANKYAKAAFNVAKKANKLEKFLKDFTLFSNSFSEVLSKELSNKAISKTDLIAILGDVSKKLSLGKEVSSFLAVVASARRIDLTEQIYSEFSELVKKDKKIVEAELFSATTLEKEQLSKIQKLLQKKYKGNTIELKQIIKKDILGGVIIKVGSIMIDASLKNQLSGLLNSCKKVSINH